MRTWNRTWSELLWFGTYMHPSRPELAQEGCMMINSNDNNSSNDNSKFSIVTRLVTTLKINSNDHNANSKSYYWLLPTFILFLTIRPVLDSQAKGL